MRTRRAAILLALGATVLAMQAAAAQAEPPTVTSVNAIDRQVAARWTLPEGVRPEFLQIATGPAVDEFGYFTQRHLVSFSALGRHDRFFRDTLQLDPGTYYVHVAGSDSRCYPDCPRIEFSDVFRVQIGVSGTATGTNMALEGPPPSHLVSCRRKQSLRRLAVKARMDINGSLTATGRLTAARGAGRRSRSFGVGPVTKPAPENRMVSIPLKLSRAARLAALRAIAAGHRPRIRITVIARDGAGRTATRTISVRLTR